MGQETFTLSQKKLQRVTVISRCVQGNNVVQWDGQRLQIHPQPRRCSFAGAKVQIHQALNGRVSLHYRDTRLQHSNLTGGDIFTLPLG